MPPVLRIIVYTLSSALLGTFLTIFRCGVILVTVQSRPGDKYFWIFFWGLICSVSYGLWHQWRNFPCLCWERRSHDPACNIRNVTRWHDGVWRVTRGRDRDWPQHVHHSITDKLRRHWWGKSCYMVSHLLLILRAKWLKPEFIRIMTWHQSSDQWTESCKLLLPTVFSKWRLNSKIFYFGNIQQGIDINVTRLSSRVTFPKSRSDLT